MPNVARQTTRATPISMPADAPVLKPSLPRLLSLVDFEGLREVGGLLGRLSADVVAEDCKMLFEMPGACE
jgi:hypothetical protein